jgi:hypothetical protein
MNNLCTVWYRSSTLVPIDAAAYPSSFRSRPNGRYGGRRYVALGAKRQVGLWSNVQTAKAQPKFPGAGLRRARRTQGPEGLSPLDLPLRSLGRVSRSIPMALVRDLNGTVEQLVRRPRQTRVIFVVGPGGRMLNRGNLPPSDTTRWVRRRKLEVVAAVRGGLLSLEEACQRYSLTAEEFQAWQSQALRFGVREPRPIVSGNAATDAKIAMLYKNESAGARTQAAVHNSNGHAHSLHHHA